MTTLQRLRHTYRTSVRTKLLTIALLPMLVVLPLLLTLTLVWGSRYLDQLLIMKINSDLVVADQYFRRVTERVGSDVQGLAESGRLLELLRRGDAQALAALLQAQEVELKLDFLHLLDANGTLRERSKAQSAFRGDDWPIVRTALGGQPATHIDVFEAAQLKAISTDLEARARLDLVPTPNAMPTDRTQETRGLVIHTATPIRDTQQRLIGVLEGGVLLNQNLDFVDRINGLVYAEGSLPAGSHGTATLFLGDVRVATNVRLFEGRRALGTRVSQAVHDKVLGRGETWLDRAFVVKDWYISAYEPIANSRGERVGMLYVGFLEQPFRLAKYWAISALLLLFAAVSVLGGSLLWRRARAIVRPLEMMDATMSAVEAGNVAARTGPVASADEVGRLARHLDEMLDLLRERAAQLQSWAEELDRKVMDRTQALEETNRQLRETQKQLVLSEKLATIGEITAGVAHEINNPAAVIQGNLDMLREVLGEAAAPVAEEIRLINHQVYRIQTLVSKLLQFARPGDYAGYVEALDVNEVLSDSLVLVRHLLQRGNISVILNPDATRSVSMNRNELQQVVINLLSNAIQAMPNGGELRLASADWAAVGVTLTVQDSGTGIRPEDQHRIFDPFFTTKRQTGTGLGLSISYTLIARYGGRITVDSEPGSGAAFTLWLPSEPEFADSDGIGEFKQAAAVHVLKDAAILSDS